MARAYRAATAIILAGATALAGCEEIGDFSLFQQPPEEGAAEAPAARGETIERDVEAPDVFSADEAGLWDGRPSLGGVWVAHPDVKDPERAVIRNTQNGEFVIGALYRRERAMPGPRLQVSSDAAEALGLLAGQPTELSVVALRRETIEVAPPPGAAETGAAGTATAAAAGEIEATPLDPVATAEAALQEAAPSAAASASAAPAPVAAAAPAASALERPYVQIGIFSVQENADNTAASLRNIGILPTVLEQSSQGKTFWRVIVGPAGTADERRVILGKVRGLGFEDAYFVTN